MNQRDYLTPRGAWSNALSSMPMALNPHLLPDCDSGLQLSRQITGICACHLICFYTSLLNSLKTSINVSVRKQCKNAFSFDLCTGDPPPPHSKMFCSVHPWGTAEAKSNGEQGSQPVVLPCAFDCYPFCCLLLHHCSHQIVFTHSSSKPQLTQTWRPALAALEPCETNAKWVITLLLWYCGR